MVIVFVSSHYELLLCSFQTYWSNRFGSVAWDVDVGHIVTAPMNANSLSGGNMMKLMIRSDMRQTWLHFCSWIIEIYILLVSAKSILVLVNRWLLSVNVLLTWYFSHFVLRYIIINIFFRCIFLQNSLRWMINLQWYMLFLSRWRWTNLRILLWRGILVVSVNSFLRWSCYSTLLFDFLLLYLFQWNWF